MGCGIKGYYEDEDKYECLCKRVGVKSLPDSKGGGAYGPHERWCRLVEKDEKELDSWDEYYDLYLVAQKHKKIKLLEDKIVSIRQEIEELKRQMNR